MIHQYNYLYKITNLINDKIYIGVHSTDDINDGYFGSGVALHRSIKKYGKENFEMKILEWFDWRCEALQREAEVVNADFVKMPNTYNLKTGGIGGLLSRETKHKISNSRTGIIFSDSHKENLRTSHIGYKASDETKLKISNANKGRAGKKLTVEQRRHLSEINSGQLHPMYGKHPSFETISKLKEKAQARKPAQCSMFGKKHNDITKSAMSKSMKGKNLGKIPWNKGLHMLSINKTGV